jgi:transposase
VYKTLETLTVYQKKGIAHFADLQAKAALYHKVQLSWSLPNND